MVRPISTHSSADSRNKNFICEERQIYTVKLKVNTVIAIGHEMIFVYTVSTKLSSTSWCLTLVDHHASTLLLVLLRDYSLGLQFRRLAQKDYQIDFFQESSVTFIGNRSLFEWRFIK